MSAHAAAIAATLLKDGSALLISGPKGSGKSTLARVIAGQVTDKVNVCAMGEIQRKRFDDHFLCEVLIVDEFELSNKNLQWLYRLSTHQTVVVELQGEEPVEAPMPQIIAVTSDPAAGGCGIHLTHVGKEGLI